jgi:hypothetical protein
MARGVGAADADLQLFFMKIAGLKEGEKVHITQAKPTEEKGKYEKLPPVQNVSGDLSQVKVREYEYQGEKKKELQLWLKDAEAKELCILACNMNSIGRSIVNTLLNLDGPKGGKLDVSVWNKKSDGRAAVFIKYDGEKVGWKYTIDEQNKYIITNELMKKGKKVIEKDYYNLDEFFIAELQKMYGNAAPRVAPTFGPPTTTVPEDIANNTIGDDLPKIISRKFRVCLVARNHFG